MFTLMKVGAMERAAAARSIAPTFMSVNMAVIQSCDTVTKVVHVLGARLHMYMC